jgi:hypothetical protein
MEPDPTCWPARGGMKIPVLLVDRLRMNCSITAGKMEPCVFATWRYQQRSMLLANLLIIAVSAILFPSVVFPGGITFHPEKVFRLYGG